MSDGDLKLVCGICLIEPNIIPDERGSADVMCPKCGQRDRLENVEQIAGASTISATPESFRWRAIERRLRHACAVVGSALAAPFRDAKGKSIKCPAKAGAHALPWRRSPLNRTGPADRRPAIPTGYDLPPSDLNPP